MKNRYFAIAASIAVVGGTIGGLTACSSGPATPQNATQVLQSDGYTPSSTWTDALQSGIGSTGGDITSSEAGTNSAGDIQAVVVWNSASEASAGVTALNTQFGSDGITTVSNGDVLTATGPLSAWASAGGN